MSEMKGGGGGIFTGRSPKHTRIVKTGVERCARINKGYVYEVDSFVVRRRRLRLGFGIMRSVACEMDGRGMVES